MKDIILKAENISKQYLLGQVGTGTLSHDLNRLWHQVLGQENPYLKIGDPNWRSILMTAVLKTKVIMCGHSRIVFLK